MRRYRLRLALAGAVALGLIGAAAVAATVGPSALPGSVIVAVSGSTQITLHGTPATITTFTPATPTYGTLSNPGAIDCSSGTECTQTFDYTPDGVHRTDSFDFTVDDGSGASAPATISVAVDTQPTASDDSTPTTTEDTGVTVTMSASDADDDPLTFNAATPGNGTLTSLSAPDCSAPPVCTETATYTPNADYNGTDSFTFTANDGYQDSAAGTITISITAVNDPPQYTAGGTVTVNEDSGSYSAGWATAIAPGPATATDEAGQTVSFVVTNVTNSGDFATQPAIASDGTLTFATKTDKNGDSTVTYHAVDSGGASTSDATFTISITAVNDPPVFTSGGDVTNATEDTAYDAAWATAIAPGPATATDEASQTVSFVVTDVSVPGLFSTAPAVDGTTGHLTFTPATDANGQSTVTLHALDSGGAVSGDVTFTITVNAVNDPPQYAVVDTVNQGDVTVNEDSGAYSGAWATGIAGGPATATDEASQTVSFVISADTNAAMFSVQPAVSAAGTLTFTPGANRNGTATLTIHALDSGGAVSSDFQFTITVTPVNDPPNAANDSYHVPESVGASLAVLTNDVSVDVGEHVDITSVTNGAHGTVTISADKQSVTYKPAYRYVGTDAFTYTITDPGALTDSATVFITVDKDLTAPVVSAPVQSLRTGVTYTSGFAEHVSWSATDPGSGVVRYEVQRQTNGGAWYSVSLATYTTTSYNVTLTNGYSYRYRVRARDYNGNISAWIYGPTFKTYRWQETSASLTYSGAWYRVYGSSFSASYVKYSLQANASVTYSMTSLRDFAIVATRSPTRGSFQVWVDGVYVTTVSTKAGSFYYRSVVWSRHFSTAGTHVIRIVVVGNGRVDLDAILGNR